MPLEMFLLSVGRLAVIALFTLALIYMARNKEKFDWIAWAGLLILAVVVLGFAFSVHYDQSGAGTMQTSNDVFTLIFGRPILHSTIPPAP